MAAKGEVQVGAVVDEIEFVGNRRGAKGKWRALFQPAFDHPNQWVCVAKGDDEEAARKLYNNVRGAAHRFAKPLDITLKVGMDKSHAIYVKAVEEE